MRNLVEKGKDKTEVWFYDGILTVIYKLPYNPAKDYYADRICICPEFDAPTSLTKILNRYPSVIMVIFDDTFSGSVYRYNNHNDGEWEKVGTTVGYA